MQDHLPPNTDLLNPDIDAIQLNQTVEFTVTVMTGDNMFLNLSFGDGNYELMYVQSAPVTLTRLNPFRSYGKKTARLTVANSLGIHEVLRVISVDRLIRKASMTVTPRLFLKVIHR